MRRGNLEKAPGTRRDLELALSSSGLREGKASRLCGQRGVPGVGTARRGVYRGGGTCHAADQLQIRLLGRWRQDPGGLEVRWSLFTLDVVGPR